MSPSSLMNFLHRSRVQQLSINHRASLEAMTVNTSRPTTNDQHASVPPAQARGRRLCGDRRHPPPPDDDVAGINRLYKTRRAALQYSRGRQVSRFGLAGCFWGRGALTATAPASAGRLRHAPAPPRAGRAPPPRLLATPRLLIHAHVLRRKAAAAARRRAERPPTRRGCRADGARALSALRGPAETVWNPLATTPPSPPTRAPPALST